MDVQRARFLPWLMTNLLFLLVLGCSADGPSFTGGVYRADGLAFELGQVSPAWHRVKVDGATIAFRDDRGSSVLVDARCNLRSDDVPLVALTNQLIMGTTARDYVKEETITLDGRDARHTVMHAKLDGVDMVWDMYVMKKDGCIYDVVLVSPLDRFDEQSGVFDHFATGLHTLESPDHKLVGAGS